MGRQRGLFLELGRAPVMVSPGVLLHNPSLWRLDSHCGDWILVTGFSQKKIGVDSAENDLGNNLES